MFAVIRTGGKQYRVAPDDVLAVEKLDAAPGDKVQLGDVLMVGEDGAAPQIGTPLLDGMAVTAEVVEQARGRKIIVFKKRRRQNSRRRGGHRQDLTLLKVLSIGKATAKKAAARKTAEAPAETAVDAGASNEE